LPILSAARHLLLQGHATGASDRNWASCEHEVTLPAGVPDWQRKILTDPQTSGGLLVACDPAAVPAVLEVFKQQGFKYATQIGRLVAGAPSVSVS